MPAHIRNHHEDHWDELAQEPFGLDDVLATALRISEEESFALGITSQLIVPSTLMTSTQPIAAPRLVRVRKHVTFPNTTNSPAKRPRL